MQENRRFRAILLLSLLCLSQALYGQARVAYSEGRVTLTRSGRESDVDIGQTLSAGDILSTDAGALLIVELDRGGELKLREKTTLALDTVLGEVEVSLREGGLFSRVERLSGRDYRVRSGGVVAGVRGTEFFVAYGRTIENEPDVWLCVNEGAVEVSLEGGGESVQVREGEGINILAGNQLTQPRPYDWTRELNWNMDPGSGPVRDETDLEQAYSDLLDQDYD